ncbi:hypothetical protein KIK06_18420 [Nocardiopsis sp. EMB25]|uniref:hypothetical protein n=1 Tax=Nocardiopsis sp. EMB25 TaxID=2835867 RepID=UPI00228421BE|nr:hypothetical protein [Nocardiopsis sp. EMB25]MCY9785868.1 hypothetical protein [Nocardiopsis sp. EMB25]
MDTRTALLRRIRIWIVLFIVGLVVSGVTAFPLPAEVRLLESLLRGPLAPVAEALPGLADWVDRIRTGLDAVESEYPFVLYGTDWLAFAHLVIAVAFYGPLRDPVRNVWVVQFGMIACVMVVPLALICGPIRGIPFFWQLIDMSFGVFGIIPLLIVHRMIRRLESLGTEAAEGTAPAPFVQRA